MEEEDGSRGVEWWKFTRSETVIGEFGAFSAGESAKWPGLKRAGGEVSLWELFFDRGCSCITPFVPSPACSIPFVDDECMLAAGCHCIAAAEAAWSIEASFRAWPTPAGGEEAGGTMAEQRKCCCDQRACVRVSVYCCIQCASPV